MVIIKHFLRSPGVDRFGANCPGNLWKHLRQSLVIDSSHETIPIDNNIYESPFPFPLTPPPRHHDMLHFLGYVTKNPRIYSALEQVRKNLTKHTVPLCPYLKNTIMRSFWSTKLSSLFSMAKSVHFSWLNLFLVCLNQPTCVFGLYSNT